MQPVIVRYDQKYGDLTHHLWERPMWTMFKSMFQFANYASLEFLDEYVPTDEEKNDPALYGENVRTKVYAKYMKNAELTPFRFVNFISFL